MRRFNRLLTPQSGIENHFFSEKNTSFLNTLELLNNMDNLYKIMNSIIRKGFQELSNVDIRLDFEVSNDEFVGYGKFNGGGYYIDVDKTLKKAPVQVIKGALAHELAHITIDYSMNPITRFFDSLLY